MGKWAQYRKRGTARFLGQVGAPLDSGWAIDVPTSTTIPATRTEARPPGVDAWKTQAMLATGGGALINSMLTAGTTATVTGLTPATNYIVRAAWFRVDGVQLSDWSAWKPATTAP